MICFVFFLDRNPFSHIIARGGKLNFCWHRKFMLVSWLARWSLISSHYYIDYPPVKDHRETISGARRMPANILATPASK
jgi:hypothetical protein